MTGSPSPPRSAAHRRAAIGALLFARDWDAACATVAADPWLLTPEASAELGEVAARFHAQEHADPALTPLHSAIGMVRQRLSLAAEIGVGGAFGDLVELDERLRHAASARWLSDVHAVMVDAPDLYSDLAFDALALLLTRTQQYDEEAGQRLWTLRNVMVVVRERGLAALREAAAQQRISARQEAEALWVTMADVPPQDATLETIGECEGALRLLEHDTESELWSQLQARLGSFLLEVRDGERSTSVARARAAYQAILDRQPSADSQAWAAAVCGIANCLVAHPQGQPGEFDQAFEWLDALLRRSRATDDHETLVTALGCAAAVRIANPTGDRDENDERALDLLRESIRVLESPDRFPARWGRAHVNLAAVYARRRVGLRSQNIDHAIAASNEALAVRTRDADPVGRARVLRNLASLLPEWSGAESQAAADELANRYLREADEIARDEPRAARRPGEWGELAGETSALDQDLDDYLQLHPTVAVAGLQAAIARHEDIIARLAPERDATGWSTWKGGLGRLQSTLAHFESDAVHAAYRNLCDAVDAAPRSNVRLCCTLYGALGALGHQIGQWDISLPAFANALIFGDALFEEVATSDSRRRELVRARGFALFGAYAAARLGKLDEAVRLAEYGRARGMAQAWAVAEMAAANFAPERSADVVAAEARVQQLEQELLLVESSDIDGVAEQLQRRLSDVIGAPPGMVKFRTTNPGSHQHQTADFIRIATELRTARGALRDALQHIRREHPDTFPHQLDEQAVRTIAATIARPIVYLLGTVWGSVAIIVSPSGPPELLRFDEMTSDVTRTLFFGAGDTRSYADGAMTDDVAPLAAALPIMLPVLRDGMMAPLARWLQEHGHHHAVLVPLGRYGLLPLHAALDDSTVSFAYAPSARALTPALAARARSTSAAQSLLAVGDPDRDLAAPLPYAVAETRVVAGRATWDHTAVLVGADASLEHVRQAAGSASHLAFACHGEYRASDPLESALLLANDDRITLRMLLAGVLELRGARLAVLSACQTANVEFRALPDEALGLPSGFLLAGVSGVVGTMWLVDDRAAALFSQQLYSELFDGGKEPVEAVAAAQRWLRDASASELATRVKGMRDALADADIDADRALSRLWRDLASRDPADRPFDAPQYWAAFTCIGI